MGLSTILRAPSTMLEFAVATARRFTARAQTVRDDRTLHSISVESLNGSSTSLAEWKGSVVLIVNTASKCGFTPQYRELQALHERYAARGFAVLGFPSNDFGAQEPGSSSEIGEFCSRNFHVTFPLFAKVVVKSGERQSPLYRWLGATTGALPAWNFGKYLVGKDGRPIAFFPSTVKPDDPALVAAIEKALA